MKHVKLKRTTVEARVAAQRHHREGYNVPKGQPKLTGIDGQRWKSLCYARDAWTDCELLQLYETVLAYRDLDAARAAAEGCPVMEDGRIHPIHAEVRRRAKGLQDWLRSVGLQTTPERANAGNAAGKKAITESTELPSNVASLVG